ncbi:MAG TPA: hypothetical protein VGB30_01710 [bacterium]
MYRRVFELPAEKIPRPVSSSSAIFCASVTDEFGFRLSAKNL